MRRGRRWGAVVVATVLLAAAAPARAEPIFDSVLTFPVHYGGAWPTSQSMTREGAFSVYAWVRVRPPVNSQPNLSSTSYAESYAIGNKHLTLEPGTYVLAYWVKASARATASEYSTATVTMSIGVDCLDLRCVQLVPSKTVAAHDGPNTEPVTLPVVVVTTVLRVHTRGSYTVAFIAKAEAEGGYQVGNPRVGPAVAPWRGGIAEVRSSGTVTSFLLTPLPSA